MVGNNNPCCFRVLITQDVNFDRHQCCTALNMYLHVPGAGVVVAWVMMCMQEHYLLHVPYVNVAMAWANDMCMESYV